MKKCNILGVKICVTDMSNTIRYIEENLKSIKGNYICVSNVHTTVMSYEDESYKNIQNSALVALPDGGPLSLVCRIKGFKEAKRVTGPDLMEEIFLKSDEKIYSHYFYGSTKETLDNLKRELMAKYPRLNIVGMYSPPFRELDKKEEMEIINKINDANADFLWIGLGAPKQEIWMSKHKDKINSLMIGVGAGFDYHANILKRAPIFMQKLCLEWLYRLLQEPKRLFRRYLVTNFKFTVYLLKENTLSK